MGFSDNLKTIRKEKNLSQEELAELLGVSRQAVSKWELGDGYPEAEKLLIMAKNMKRIYESRGIITSDITTMHSYIVRRIYKIRKNDKESRELIIKLRPYLEYVFNKSEKGGGGYCVEPLDPDE